MVKERECPIDQHCFCFFKERSIHPFIYTLTKHVRYLHFNPLIFNDSESKQKSLCLNYSFDMWYFFQCHSQIVNISHMLFYIAEVTTTTYCQHTVNSEHTLVPQEVIKKQTKKKQAEDHSSK